MKVKRFSSFRFYFINILLFVVIIIIAGIMLAFFLCPVRDVSVQGTDIYTKDEIKDTILTEKYDNNTIFAFLRCKFTPHKKIEFVEDYSVSIKNRNTLMIKVTQKEIRGYVLGGKENYVYYDADGKVLENTKKYIGEIFFVDGFVAKKAKAGKMLPIGKSNVKTILAIQEAFEKENLDVSHVVFSDDGTISFDVGTIHINLGTRSLLSEKIHRLPYILPQLEGQAGTLHLEEWSEENTDIVFEKSEQ